MPGHFVVVGGVGHGAVYAGGGEGPGQLDSAMISQHVYHQYLICTVQSRLVSLSARHKHNLVNLCRTERDGKRNCSNSNYPNYQTSE